MRNELHISSANSAAGAAAGFIGTSLRLAACGAAAALIALSACDEKKSTGALPGGTSPGPDEQITVRDLAADQPREARWTPDGASADASPPLDPPRPVDAGAPGREGWSIVLATYATSDHREIAARWLALFQEVTSFTGAWVDSDERGSIVRYGSYPSIDAKAAQADLSKLKNFEHNGGFPFSRAYLSRYGSANSAGRLREYQLTQARKMFPREDTVYSLQIAVYEAEQATTAEQARRLAEEAVTQLRSQGEMAFYYHGPNRSMVCVGAFPSTAADSATGLYSPEVRELQQRFPYNSFNGRSLEERIVTTSGENKKVRQPSFLVQVPME